MLLVAVFGGAQLAAVSVLVWGVRAMAIPSRKRYGKGVLISGCFGAAAAVSILLWHLWRSGALASPTSQARADLSLSVPFAAEVGFVAVGGLTILCWYAIPRQDG